MSKFRLYFYINNSYISQFVFNPKIVYLCIFSGFIIAGCTSQLQQSELSSTPDSSIPSEREFAQPKSEFKGLIKESEQLEKEVDDFIGSRIPKGEELYKNLSTAKYDWLIKRAEFYKKFAENLNEQAKTMTPGYPPQAKTLELAKSAHHRTSIFQQEINKRCSVKQ